MKISQLLAQKEQSISLEFFPPKDQTQHDRLLATVQALQVLKPTFASVTYGAMGSTQERTFELVSLIQKQYGIETMAHLTCIGATKEKIAKILQQLKQEKIDNVLALRGDFPDEYDHQAHNNQSDFSYAYQLVQFIRTQPYDFSIGVAGYPEGHIETSSWQRDLDYLKLKVDQGADFIIAQLFFINDNFFRFIDGVRKRKITVPIIAGIMPVSNVRQLHVFQEKCGVTIPDSIKSFLVKHEHDKKSIRDFGIEYATSQCQELINNGFQRLHFYTLNQSASILKICKNLGLK